MIAKCMGMALLLFALHSVPAVVIALCVAPGFMREGRWLAAFGALAVGICDLVLSVSIALFGWTLLSV